MLQGGATAPRRSQWTHGGALLSGRRPSFARGFVAPWEGVVLAGWAGWTG